MEGVGSRLSRTSSRYSGPAAAAAVFTGRVRKWKKQWVHVSPSSTAGYRTTKSNGRSNASTSSNLFLCKWTPLSSSSAVSGAGEVTGSGETEEPPRRRFRYTPIAMLEQREKAVSKKPETEGQAEETDEFETKSPSPKNVELNMNINMMMDMEQTEEAKTGHLDLGLCLKGLNDEDDHVN